MNFSMQKKNVFLIAEYLRLQSKLFAFIVCYTTEISQFGFMSIEICFFFGKMVSQYSEVQ